jgi:hypothetical protein
MSFYVDIESDGAIVGDGPLTNVTSWRVVRRMDRAGSFEFALPATDPNADQIQPRRVASIYAQLAGAGAYTYVGGGYIDRIGRSVGKDGDVTLTVSGDDTLRQLANELVTVEQDGGAFTVTAFLPTGWTATVATPPINDLYYSLQYETKLGALLKVAERAQTHFYLSGRSAITVAHTWTASGVRAAQVTGDVAAEVAAITALAVEAESYDLATRIYPLGSGNSGAALTLLACTETAPTGYTLDTAANYIQSTAALAAYGAIHRAVQFGDIRPLSSTDADVQAAADALFLAALYWLAQHEAPTVSYRLALAQCSSLLRPLQTVRLAYRDLDAGLDLDADLYILEATLQGDAYGVQTTNLVVANGARWPADSANAIADGMQQASVYRVHPQLNANSYVLPYSKNVDQTATANFRFRFDDEVLQLTRVTFDFQLLALESTVTAVGLEQSTSGTITTSFTGNSGASGAASTGEPSTNTSSTPSSNTSGTPSSNTSGTPSTNTTSAASGDTGAASGNTGAASGDTGAASGNTGASGTLETEEPDGGDIVANGRHQHTFGITLGAASVTYPIGYGASGTSGGLVSTLSGSTHNYPTNQSGNHDHEIDPHTHSLNSHAHSLNSHAHSLNSHTHSLNSHTHSLASHTHDLGNHTHDLGNHTHDLASHTHTIAHTHTIDHTHTFTPSVTTTYGIYRDDAGNVFAATDLEYSLDGSTWYDFAVGVNGYAVLGDGWTRVDLTALLQDATTLRPTAANNLLRIRRKSTGATGKMATIDAQMNVRTIIQAVALT